MLYIHGSAQDRTTQVRQQWSYGGSALSHRFENIQAETYREKEVCKKSAMEGSSVARISLFIFFRA